MLHRLLLEDNRQRLIIKYEMWQEKVFVRAQQKRETNRALIIMGSTIFCRFKEGRTRGTEESEQ